MEFLDNEKKRFSEYKKNNYYSNKFYALKLEKIRKGYENAISNLKIAYRILAIHNSNICVYDSSIKRYSLIKKEHFIDYLDEHQKENCYKNIKKFADAISKANRILNEWNEDLETFKRNYCEITNTQTISSIYIPMYLAMKFFQQTISNIPLPQPLQPKHPPALDEKFEFQQPSEEVVDYIYQLSNGDIKNLQNIAKFSYQLIYEPQKNLASVILAKEEIHESLNEYFNLLAYPYMPNNLKQLEWIDFNTMRIKENRFPLLMHEFDKDLPIFLVKGNTIYKKGEAHSFFKKLFTGKKIKIDSPHFNDELILKNTIPIVCLIGDQKKYRALKNLYKINGINITAQELNVPEKSSKSGDWLRREFLCIGQKQVKINHEIVVPYEMNHERIVQKFLRICCTFGTSKTCTKRALHKAYMQYFEHCYPEEKCLTQRTLCGIVQKLKCEQLEVRRIHNSRTEPNLNHFIGMALKENYSELYKDETVHRKAKNKRDKFEIAFKKLLNETFSDVQVNKRKVTKTIDIKQ